MLIDLKTIVALCANWINYAIFTFQCSDPPTSSWQPGCPTNRKMHSGPVGPDSGRTLWQMAQAFTCGWFSFYFLLHKFDSKSSFFPRFPMLSFTNGGSPNFSKMKGTIQVIFRYWLLIFSPIIFCHFDEISVIKSNITTYLIRNFEMVSL